MSFQFYGGETSSDDFDDDSAVSSSSSSHGSGSETDITPFRTSHKRRRPTQTQWLGNDHTSHVTELDKRFMGVASIEEFDRSKRLFKNSRANSYDIQHHKTTPTDPKGNERPLNGQTSVDFESFLNENADFLPDSNWEVEFLLHQAEVMAKAAAISERRFYDDTFSDDDEEPWHPYDPDYDQYRELPDLDAVDSGSDFLDCASKSITVCFGIIHKVAVRILPQAPSPLQRLLEDQGNPNLQLFEVVQEEKSMVYILKPPGSGLSNPASSIAVVNTRHGSILSQLTSSYFCFFEACSPAKNWSSIAEGTIGKDTHELIDLIIYGPNQSVEDVGNFLNSESIFLQVPDYQNSAYGYNNPHMLDFGELLNHNVEDGASGKSFCALGALLPDNNDIATNSQALLKKKVELAFRKTTRSENLKRVKIDCGVIRTPLKSYQEEALDFIQQRETGPIPEEYRLWKSVDGSPDSLCTHTVTGEKVADVPPETGGGILADEMGLGKTLTMLSAIAKTVDEAARFAKGKDTLKNSSVGSTLVPSKATLVIVPSPLLLNEWEQEIKEHCISFSNIIIYHGHGRTANENLLADADIVLSTYHTLAHESHDKTSPMWKINWFRVILDEAHIIRRMSTKLFKAMKKLTANYRWCLTGTPVQNTLEDFVALISFIGASPLDNIHHFRKFIISPLMKHTESGVDNLRQLLDSICLRRTKELLNLPHVIEDLQTLTFSAREQQHYSLTREKLIKLIKLNTLQPKSNKKGYLGVFQLQLQLRRLCNHGTFQKSTLGTEEFDPQQAMAHLKKSKQADCEVCNIKITGIQGIEEKRSGNFTVCGHLLCRKCETKLKAGLKPVEGKENCSQCSLCSETIFGDYMVEEESLSKSSKRGTRHLSPWQYFDKDGFSTKVSAVLADIERNRDVDGKCIIFSCWTRSLDLVGIFLKHRNIPFVRIDGSHSTAVRKLILADFQNNIGYKILLMTTGTGSIGLNLTVANCVYLLEPQWNPMVENQAIARVLRLGQTRNVRVVRYVMKETIEEKELRTQQIEKLKYAKMGWKEGS